jgi:hypothetical protein
MKGAKGQSSAEEDARSVGEVFNIGSDTQLDWVRPDTRLKCWVSKPDSSKSLKTESRRECGTLCMLSVMQEFAFCSVVLNVLDKLLNVLRVGNGRVEFHGISIRMISGKVMLFGQEAFAAPGGLEACGRADEFHFTAQAYL